MPPRQTPAGRGSCRACGTGDGAADWEKRPCLRIAGATLIPTGGDLGRGQNGTSPVILKSDSRPLARPEVNEWTGRPRIRANRLSAAPEADCDLWPRAASPTLGSRRARIQ